MPGSAASNAARAFAVLVMVTSLSRSIYACPGTASSVMVRALILVGFPLAAVDRAVRMLRRGIDRVQAQRLALRGIHHVVLGAARNHYRRAVVQGVALAVDDRFALARLDADELVAPVVVLRRRSPRPA